MGTLQGILDYEPPEGGVYIPPKVAMLSAPAFASLIASECVNEGILGFHLLYDPETGDSDFQRQILTMRVLYVGDNMRGDLVSMDALKHTDAGTFYCLSGDPRFNRRFMTTDEIRAAGFEIKSRAADLLPVPERGRGYKNKSNPSGKNTKPTEQKE